MIALRFGRLRRVALAAAVVFVLGGAGLPPPTGTVLFVTAEYAATFKCPLHALLDDPTRAGGSAGNPAPAGYPV